MKRKSQITLVPTGGLGNRMNAIPAGIRLAEACGCPLRVVWCKDWGLGCRFDELFSLINHPLVTVREASRLDLLTLDTPRRHNLWVPALYQHLAFDVRMKDVDVARFMQQGNDFIEWASGKSVWMGGYNYFMSEERPADVFDCFRPIPLLQQQIDERMAKMGNDVMGVHIRRTDNAEAIAASPTEAFVARMRKEPETTHFYVATDDEGVKAELHREFPGRITTLPRQADRGSLQGMQDALIEMYTLARCRCILGSVHSSYSQTAAIIGRTPLEVITKH